MCNRCSIIAAVLFHYLLLVVFLFYEISITVSALLHLLLLLLLRLLVKRIDEEPGVQFPQLEFKHFVLQRGQSVAFEPLPTFVQFLVSVFQEVIMVIVREDDRMEKDIIPIRIRRILLMLKHMVASNLSPVSGDPISVVFDTIGHVIILTTPSPELVGKAVHMDHLVLSESTDSAKNVPVWQPADW